MPRFSAGHFFFKTFVLKVQAAGIFFINSSYNDNNAVNIINDTGTMVFYTFIKCIKAFM